MPNRTPDIVMRKVDLTSDVRELWVKATAAEHLYPDRIVLFDIPFRKVHGVGGIEEPYIVYRAMRGCDGRID